MNRFFFHIALLLCALQVHANDSIDDAAPRSFGYAIRTGLISAFAMRLYRQNKRKVFGDYKSLYSKRSDNISARTGSSYIHPKHPRLTWTTIEDYYPTN